MDSSPEQSKDDDGALGVADKEMSTGDEGGGDHQSHASEGQNTADPVYVQKRLKQQKRSHEREMREMQARIEELQQQVSQPNQQQQNVYQGQNEGQGGMDDTIQKAVGYALQQRDMEERKAKDAQHQQELAKQYQNLQRHLDQTSDKYEDFDQLVRDPNLPFTHTIRDAALMLPTQGAGSAGEVLYKLGKNPEELERISKMLPHQQAQEVIKLSHALIQGGGERSNTQRPIGSIKANPVVNSAGVTEKTSPAQIRALMKAGKFK